MRISKICCKPLIKTTARRERIERHKVSIQKKQKLLCTKSETYWKLLVCFPSPYTVNGCLRIACKHEKKWYKTKPTPTMKNKKRE